MACCRSAGQAPGLLLRVQQGKRLQARDGLQQVLTLGQPDCLGPRVRIGGSHNPAMPEVQNTISTQADCVTISTQADCVTPIRSSAIRTVNQTEVKF
jgi:hypothetical protein